MLALDGLRDGQPLVMDYFQNSVIATYAHRAFCLSLRGMYPHYSELLWGVSASDSEIGYINWVALHREEMIWTARCPVRRRRITHVFP